jgi:nucleotide-binding universal stress UspA family protein
MFKRILVAVDGSDTSYLGLREAIALAKDQHSALQIIHVIDLTVAYTAVEAAHVYDAAEAPYIAEHKKALQAAGQKVLAHCSVAASAAGIECDSKLIVIDTLGQHVYDAIEDEAKRWRADLIVIGTHGRRGYRWPFLGSVAEGLARVASKSVLLVRGEETGPMGRFWAR